MNTFTFTGKAKATLLIVMLVGLAFIGLGALTFGGGSHAHDEGHGDAHGETHGQAEQVDVHADELQHEDDAHDVTVDEAHTESTETLHDESHGETVHATADEDLHEVGHEADAHDMDGHADISSHGGGHHEGIIGATPVTAGKVLWTNLWVIVQMLFWMAMAAMFFLAAHTVGWSGFHIMFQKVTLGIMSILPVAIVLGIVVFIFGHHDIFIWTNPAAMEASELMASKSDFLNFKTFGILSVAWSLIVVFLLSRWWKKLKAQDVDPDLKHFRSARTLAAITIVLVAIINAFGVWHWLMSIEPNWYSTMYAWYTMASGAAIMFAVTILVLLYLQSQGYLPDLNDSHYHDIGKYLFAISVFWTYVWFSQYMLIWYGNIPEETVYFKERLASYPVIWYGALILNFFLAFFVLLKRDAKRNKGVLIFACIMIIIGHWFDFFIMVVPYGVAKGGMGLMSVGTLLLFVGITGFVILSALTRVKSLDSREHPYYHESLKHHI